MLHILFPELRKLFPTLHKQIQRPYDAETEVSTVSHTHTHTHTDTGTVQSQGWALRHAEEDLTDLAVQRYSRTNFLCGELQKA